MNRKLKGVSLVECLVALAVFAIMGSLLIVGISTVVASNKYTKRTITKINYETPTAELKDASYKWVVLENGVEVDTLLDGTPVDANTTGDANTMAYRKYLYVDDPVGGTFIIYNKGRTIVNGKIWSYVTGEGDPIMSVFTSITSYSSWVKEHIIQLTDAAGQPAGESKSQESTLVTSITSWEDSIGYEITTSLVDVQPQLDVNVQHYQVLDQAGNPTGFKYAVPTTVTVAAP